jgi:hypothetical protein
MLNLALRPVFAKAVLYSLGFLKVQNSSSTKTSLEVSGAIFLNGIVTLDRANIPLSKF